MSCTWFSPMTCGIVLADHFSPCSDSCYHSQITFLATQIIPESSIQRSRWQPTLRRGIPSLLGRGGWAAARNNYSRFQFCCRTRITPVDIAVGDEVTPSSQTLSHFLGISWNPQAFGSIVACAVFASVGVELESPFDLRIGALDQIPDGIIAKGNWPDNTSHWIFKTRDHDKVVLDDN